MQLPTCTEHKMYQLALPNIYLHFFGTIFFNFNASVFIYCTVNVLPCVYSRPTSNLHFLCPGLSTSVQYWPEEEDQSLKVGDITVTLNSEEHVEDEDHVLRSFTVTHAQVSAHSYN